MRAGVRVPDRRSRVREICSLPLHPAAHRRGRRRWSPPQCTPGAALVIQSLMPAVAPSTSLGACLRGCDDRILFLAFVVAYLPGALIFRLPVADRARRAALAADERVFWHVMLSVAWSLAVVLALAARAAYRFDAAVAIDGDAARRSSLVGGRTGLRYRGTAQRLSLAVVLPIALVALGVWRFFPSSEYVIGGKDPGDVHQRGHPDRAARRARRFTIRSSRPCRRRSRSVLSATASTTRLRQPRGSWASSCRIRDAGTVVGQFPHLFPASIAIGYGIDGLTGARSAVGVWAILGLLAVYFAGARLCGRAGAFAAAVLLALNVVRVWFARYPNAEIAMQALRLRGAARVRARAHQDDDRFFAPVAGALRRRC